MAKLMCFPSKNNASSLSHRDKAKGVQYPLPLFELFILVFDHGKSDAWSIKDISSLIRENIIALFIDISTYHIATPSGSVLIKSEWERTFSKIITKRGKPQKIIIFNCTSDCCSRPTTSLATPTYKFTSSGKIAEKAQQFKLL